MIPEFTFKEPIGFADGVKLKFASVVLNALIVPFPEIVPLRVAVKLAAPKINLAVPINSKSPKLAFFIIVIDPLVFTIVFPGEEVAKRKSPVPVPPRIWAPPLENFTPPVPVVIEQVRLELFKTSPLKSTVEFPVPLTVN